MAQINEYVAGYQVIDKVSLEENRKLSSPLAVIGDKLKVEVDEKSGDLILYTSGGERIGACRPKNRLTILNSIENDWICESTLSLVYYDRNKNHYYAEFVYQCFNPNRKSDKAIKSFKKYQNKIRKLIAEGKRPSVKLSSSQFNKVIDTNGEFDPKLHEPLPKGVGVKNSGLVVYKENSSFVDKLVDEAQSGNKGCQIASYVILGIVIILVALLVYRIISGF